MRKTQRSPKKWVPEGTWALHLLPPRHVHPAVSAASAEGHGRLKYSGQHLGFVVELFQVRGVVSRGGGFVSVPLFQPSPAFSRLSFPSPSFPRSSYSSRLDHGVGLLHELESRS